MNDHTLYNTADKDKLHAKYVVPAIQFSPSLASVLLPVMPNAFCVVVKSPIERFVVVKGKQTRNCNRYAERAENTTRYDLETTGTSKCIHD